MDTELEQTLLQHLDAGRHADAITLAIRELGPELLGYVRALLRDDQAANEVFSDACEDMWRGVASFRKDASFKTWAYRVTYHAAARHFRDPFRRRAERLETDARIEAAVRTTTAIHLRQESKDMLAELRATLTPEDQTLLVLRIDRDMSWSAIATVLAEDGAPAPEATLRKRFERLKDRLRDEARARGLLDS